MCAEMIRFYAESRVASRKIMPTTAPAIMERLERIFRELESGFGVHMEAEKITGLNAKILQTWFNQLSGRCKPTTMNNYVCALRPFLKWAATMDGADGSPFLARDYSDVLHTVAIPDPAKLPPQERPKDKFVTDEQMRTLLSRNAGHNVLRDRAIMGLIAFSSLRVSELCSLTVGQVQNRATGSVLVRRKGGAMVQTAIGDPAYRLIDAYLATRPNAQPDEPLFLTINGAPCNRIQIYKALANKQKHLDMATGPHALRHACITGLEKTSSASIARDAANHRSFAVTNRYVHTSVDERRAALSALPWA